MIFVNAKYFRLRHAVKNRIQRSDISKAVPNNAPIIFKSSVYLGIRIPSFCNISVSVCITSNKYIFAYFMNTNKSRFFRNLGTSVARNLATSGANVASKVT